MKTYNDVEKNNPAKQAMYKGLFVDGGMLNNFPIHAFNEVNNPVDVIYKYDMKLHIRKDFEYSSKHKYIVGQNSPFSEAPLNSKTLGIRCGVDKTSIPKLEDIYPSESKIQIVNYVGQLLEAFLYPSESGQIRNEKEKKQTIQLETTYNVNQLGFKFEIPLEITDFAHPEVDKKRGARGMALLKEKLINKAYNSTINALKLIIIIFLFSLSSCLSDEKNYPNQNAESRLWKKFHENSAYFEIIDHRNDSKNEPMIKVNRYKSDSGASDEIKISAMGKRMTPFNDEPDSIDFSYHYYNKKILFYNLNDSIGVVQGESFNTTEEDIKGGGGEYTINCYEGKIIGLRHNVSYSRYKAYRAEVDRKRYDFESIVYFFHSKYTKGTDIFYVFFNYNDNGTIKGKIELKNIMWTFPQLLNFITDKGFDTLKSNIQFVRYDPYKNNLDTTELH